MEVPGLPKAIPVLLVLATAAPVSATAQVVFAQPGFVTTVEAYANVTAGDVRHAGGGEDPATDDLRLDAALRLLTQTRNADGSDWGARLVVERSPEHELELAEASLLFFGQRGRLEIGDRQGLPDVLTGYAPNNFTFTSAEFGPASGPSLDPGAGLPLSFIGRDLAGQIAALAGLGATAALSDDRSTKLLYVSPKSRGYLVGLSVAPDADDERFETLVQAGVTREWYWSQHVLRLGGSCSRAEGRRGQDDLDSLHAGVTATLSDALSLGIAATWNGASGLPDRAAHDSTAAGMTVSVNYNTGPWTLGGYAQHARAEGDTDARGTDVLDVIEVGASWRYNTRLRIFASVYAWRFSDEGAPRDDGQVWLLGLRATL